MTGEARLMGPAEQKYVRERLSGLERGVRLVVFTRRGDCESCAATERLVGEIAELIPLVQAEIVGEDQPQRAADYGVQRRPALAVEPAGVPGPANGVRFFGFPGGYEFDSLLAAIERVAGGDPGLDAGLLAYARDLRAPLHLQVFVTQTCPYCPRMVQLAHRLALASPLVRADMVDAADFPQLAARYRVQGVPLTVIGDRGSLAGAVPESRLLAELRRAVA